MLARGAIVCDNVDRVYDLLRSLYYKDKEEANLNTMVVISYR